jgi:ribosome-binding protein aMBF1 (putative translation factor)
MTASYCVKCGKELGFRKIPTTEGTMCHDCYQKWKDEKKQSKEQEKQMMAQMSPEERAAQAQAAADKTIFSFEDSSEELMADIEKSLDDVVRQERGTGWSKNLAMVTGTASDQLMVHMLKAIVDQNKIIIRQNELLRRSLNGNAPAGK